MARSYEVKQAPAVRDFRRAAQLMNTLVLVVLGHSLTGTRRRLVTAAERAARELRAELVVFSGWAPNGTTSEAEQMRALWRGPSTVEIVLEETASTTAENAARTLPLLLERGVTDAVVICTPLHLPRASWIFRRVYGDHGIGVRVRPAREVPTPGALLWELGALTVAARQLRAARSRRKRA
jgi:uncharacterized SAM-binding protein YcdF (DUF218 family)